jgi:hypothetical protein
MLRQNLEAIIKAYIKQAESHNVKFGFFGVLNTHGKKKGIERANDYLASIQHFNTDEELIRKVYADITAPEGDGVLGSSQDLRNELYKGMFQFLKVSDETVQRRVSSAVSAVTANMSAYGCSLTLITNAEKCAKSSLLADAMCEKGYLIQKIDDDSTELRVCAPRS